MKIKKWILVGVNRYNLFAVKGTKRFAQKKVEGLEAMGHTSIKAQQDDGTWAVYTRVK